jgi:outer membrane protein assembly factor BamB
MVRLLVLVLFGWVSLVTVVPTEAGSRTSAGDLLWQVDFDLADGDDRATAVAAAHGRVVVVGFATNAAGDTDWIVRAHEATTGRILWRDRVAVAGRHEEALAVAVDEQRVVVAGVSVDDTGRSRALVRAYVARTGALAWRDAWTGSGVSLAMDEGAVVVASIVTNATGAGRILVRRYFSKNGFVAWEDRSAPTGFTAGSIAPRGLVIHGREVYLATTVAPIEPSTPGPTLSCLVRAYDLRSGRVRWNAIRTSSRVPGLGGCIPLTIASDGRRVAVAGVGDFTFDQFVVLSFDARDGDFLWDDMTTLVSLRNVAMAVAIERGQALVAGWRHIRVTPSGRRSSFAATRPRPAS